MVGAFALTCLCHGGLVVGLPLQWSNLSLKELFLHLVGIEVSELLPSPLVFASQWFDSLLDIVLAMV